MSTASCAPCHKGKPLAMTSMRRSSNRLAMTLRSRERVGGHARAGAGFPTHTGGIGHPRPRRAPDLAQAARWSPRGSRGRRHRQLRADRGKGRRRRRKKRARRWSEGKDSSGQVGTLVKGRLLKGPVWECKSAWEPTSSRETRSAWSEGRGEQIFPGRGSTTADRKLRPGQLGLQSGLGKGAGTQKVREAGRESRTMRGGKAKGGCGWQHPKNLVATGRRTKQKKKPGRLQVRQRTDALEEPVLVFPCAPKLRGHEGRVATRGTKDDKATLHRGKAGIPYPHGLGAGTKLSHAGGLNARSVPNPCLATMELDTGVLAQVEGQRGR